MGYRICLLFAAALMYCMTSLIPMFKWMFQLAFFVSLVICLNFFINHSMTQWIYQLSESDFTVIKQTGTKQITVCSLALSINTNAKDNTIVIVSAINTLMEPSTLFIHFLYSHCLIGYLFHNFRNQIHNLFLK